MTSAPKAALTNVDACSLLTKAEVEALVGKPVRDPHKEIAGNLVTCSFGDPASPMVGDRPLSKLLSIEVFTGQEAGYYAGAAAQAKDGYEQTRQNAGPTETVTGVGDSAYWDKTFHNLQAVKGRYWLTVGVDSEAERDVARQAMLEAMARLP